MDTETAYLDALDYLYSFVDYSLTHNFPAPENFDLDRMRDFLSHLGDPHMTYPVIHIAGTKGKGSVAAMCASVLEQTGYLVGLYTSPHLTDYAERIQLNGHAISHTELIKLVDEVRPYLDMGTRLTTFEITTVLAFLYFARQGATVVVAEVGLGGRLDATNVVQSLVSVITSISYDHTKVLGETLPEIAREKAGIIKPGVPVITAPQDESVLQVLKEITAEHQSRLVMVGSDYLYKSSKKSIEGQSLLIWNAAENKNMETYIKGGDTGDWQPLEIQIPLLGDHQLENAATAYVALKMAQDQGLSVDEKALISGFAQVDWPARFEILCEKPLLVIDSAHNRDSAAKLCHTLDEYFPNRPVILLFGASHDKDIVGMLEELLPRVSEVVFSRSYHPRSIDPEDLLSWTKELRISVHIIPKVEDALEFALSLASDESLVLVTGSQFIAAGARDTWYNQQA